jgi:hypothetical protein
MKPPLLKKNTLTSSAILGVVLLFVTRSFGADVDDQIVKKWIAASITPPGNETEDVDGTFNKSLSPDQCFWSWARMKTCRDAGNSLDLNLAAAEHYMFIRAVANQEGDSGLRSLPKFYETVKTFATKLDLESWLTGC